MSVASLGRAILLGIALAFSNASCWAQAKYSPGASDREITIGNIAPYSGPASLYSAEAKMLAGYFKMINEGGGIRGRKINFVSYDDAYSPPKTVEQARKLVEGDEVLLLFMPIGTAGNAAIQKFLNQKKVPQLFVGSGSSRFGNPAQFPWTMGWQPTYRAEGRAYGKYLNSEAPESRIGVLFQNDDLGKEYLQGLKEGLGEDHQKRIVAEIPFEVTSPTVSSEVATIKAANPDVFVNFATPKAAAQAIRSIADLGWRPAQILANVSSSIGYVLKPAGLENARGIITVGYYKDPTDPQWNDDPALQAWRRIVEKYAPDVPKNDGMTLFAYAIAQTLTKVLEAAGDDLTRENIIRQAANMDFELDVLVPGIRVKTSADDYFPLEQFELRKFNGESWQRFGRLIDSR